MSAPRFSRIALSTIHGAVALTAVLGGGTMILASVMPGPLDAIAVPGDYLEGSPFDSYLIPGILLALVVGGSHVLALIAQLRRTPLAAFWSAVAAFGLLIWIFVQMTVIPFSTLQLGYFAAGIAEAALVLLSLGVLESRPVGAARSR